MNTRWKATNCRHQHFQIQGRDKIWHSVGRTDLLEGSFACAILSPRLTVVGVRRSEGAARRLVEASAYSWLQKRVPWWFVQIYRKPGDVSYSFQLSDSGGRAPASDTQTRLST